jgi:hypothetical protein
MKIKVLFYFVVSNAFDVLMTMIQHLKRNIEKCYLWSFNIWIHPDTGNNSSRFHYEIKYTNPNNVAIKGASSITSNYDGLILTPIKEFLLILKLQQILAYRGFNVESPFDPSYATIKSIKFVSAK